MPSFFFTLVEVGEDKNARYEYYLSYNVPICEEQITIPELVMEIVTSDMTSYKSCIAGYSCNLGDMVFECDPDTNTALVSITFEVSCENVFATGAVRLKI